jgi:poly-gamma-glutamate synthesis protein (capsule biosynthesis protein)
VRFNALRDRDYDPSMILRHVGLARERGADLVVSLHHWGLEFEYYPPPRIVARAHELLEAGIDVIIGHHPHILNPAEWYVTGDGRRTACFYSVGNITSWALVRPVQRMAEIVSIEVESGVGETGRRVVRPKSVTITPTYFLLRHPGTPRADHRIVALLECAERIRRGDPPSYLSAAETRTVLHLERQHRRYLRQSAFAYR